MPEAPEDESNETEIDPPCPAMGSLGIHTEGYYDGDRCEWCGAKKIPVTD